MVGPADGTATTAFPLVMGQGWWAAWAGVRNRPPAAIGPTHRAAAATTSSPAKTAATAPTGNCRECTQGLANLVAIRRLLRWVVPSTPTARARRRGRRRWLSYRERRWLSYRERRWLSYHERRWLSYHEPGRRSSSVPELPEPVSCPHGSGRRSERPVSSAKSVTPPY